MRGSGKGDNCVGLDRQSERVDPLILRQPPASRVPPDLGPLEVQLDHDHVTGPVRRRIRVDELVDQHKYAILTGRDIYK